MHREEDTSSVELAAVQEAVAYADVDDRRLMGSLFWRQWHFLYSPKAGKVLFNYRDDPREDRRLEPTTHFETLALAAVTELHDLDNRVRVRVSTSENPDQAVRIDTLKNLDALGYLAE